MFLITVFLAYNVLTNACEQVCFPRVGCFDDCPPFENFPLPNSPEDIGTEFELYTRNNRNNPETINEDNLGDNFDGDREKTFLILHGFAGSGADDWVLEMKDALLNQFDCNLISVDWSWGAIPDISRPLDPVPASNSRVVGRLIGNLLLKANEQGTSFQSMQCIGFSVGAQGCAFLGKYLQSNHSQTIGRITGLDPAGDIFIMTDPKGRLDKTDARFTDIIHTNAYGTIISSGTTILSGHVDFYANRGASQPGCEEDGLAEDICNHLRSTELFTDSLIPKSCKFLARPCPTIEDIDEGCLPCTGNMCQEFGMNSINLPGRGIYHFNTGDGKNGTFCLPN